MTRSAYTTIEDVQNYLGITIDESLTALVNTYIASVTRQMDLLANRKLVADTYDSDEQFEIKYFDITNPSYLTLDDFVELESVEKKSSDTFEDVTEDATAYPTLPPHRKIMYSFPMGLQTARIRARWGYFEELPDDINLACAILVGAIYNSRKQNSGENVKPVVKEKIGNYEVWFETGSTAHSDFQSALGIISGYRRILI